MRITHRLAFLAVLLSGANLLAAGTFRVATYNVENYLDQSTESRHFVKTAEETEALRSMQGDEHVTGADTNIHVAVLSKLPFAARRPHTNDNFLLDGRRFQVSRGFAEVDIQADTNFTVTVIVAHLKSRRAVPEADEAELRLQEAKVLRGIVDSRLTADPEARIIVAGDFNDVKSSNSTKEIIGRGKFKLTDTRPAERNGDNLPNPVPRFEPRNVTWTHYYGLEDSYSRIDYILLSPALARDWVTNETYALTIPNWGIGSDHRPIVATFKAD